MSDRTLIDIRAIVDAKDAEIERLTAELASARQDAARYRWARDEIYYKPPGWDGCPVGRWVWDWQFASTNGDDLDAAIDTAIGEKA